MGQAPTGPTNIYLRKLARTLWKTQRPIWRDVSKLLMMPTRNRVEKNLGAINRVVNDGDVIVVPGKVLATGILQKKITIACYTLSQAARKKLEASKSERLTIEQLVERNPTGKGVRIII
jgi:large subunit ribosomal protein L18e